MVNREIEEILGVLERYLLGKRRQLEHALACLFAEGHLLIEDVPGIGKTTLAKSLANCIDARFNRVQFTSDLLPSDLIGVTVFHQVTSHFEFQQGPIFTNVFLADEINRANPKTQSALLEAMHDAQVSHDGKTVPLPSPFFVVATQNSKDHHGTFPLPESQLDRFLMKIQLGYPSAHFEKRVIQGDYDQNYEGVAKISLDDLRALQQATREVHVSSEILDFIYRIVYASRKHPALRVGISPRGGQGMYRAAQALALVRGRDFVIPDDIIELALIVFGHRVMPRHHHTLGDQGSDEAIQEVFSELLSTVAVPV